MAVKDLSAVPPEVLTYDGIFLNDLSITQQKMPLDSDDPVYNVTLAYKRYAVDSSGQRHYEGASSTITIPDFYNLAQTKAIALDTSLVDVLAAIQTAFVTILKDNEGINATEV